MIPKLIHCCWFGGKKTPLAERCLASWRKYATQYEIRESNELPPDAPKFVRQACERRQWAFVADWLRFRLLYDCGGVYFDFDVELMASIDNLPEGEWCAGEFGIRGNTVANPGSGIALEAHSPLARMMLDYYDQCEFDGRTTVGSILTSLLKEDPAKSLTILSPEVFSPIDFAGRSHCSSITLGVHHYALSWMPWWRRLLRWVSWHGGRPSIDALLKLKPRSEGRGTV